MDDLENKNKSKSGHNFNKYVYDILNEFKDNHLIIGFKKEPGYALIENGPKQFHPDFEITLNNYSKIIIDNTTTIRSDRVKQKQWDSYGIKKYFEAKSIKVFCYIIVPNKVDIGNSKTNEKEIHMYLHERLKILSDEYFSMIDDILEIDELKYLIKSSTDKK